MKTILPFPSVHAMWRSIGFIPGEWRFLPSPETGDIAGLPVSGIAVAVDKTRLLLIRPDGHATIHNKDNFVPLRERNEDEECSNRKPRKKQQTKDIARYV